MKGKERWDVISVVSVATRIAWEGTCEDGYGIQHTIADELLAENGKGIT